MNYTIRDATPADAPAIAHIRVCTWRHAYKNILPAEYLTNLSETEATSWLTDTIQRANFGKFAIIAEVENGQAVGYSLGGPERDDNPDYRGEIYAIYIMPEYHRLGIGKKLMIESVRRLLNQHISSMLLWVLADNLASRAFYEAMGGEQIGTDITEISNGKFDMVAYGWRDVQQILSQNQ